MAGEEETYSLNIYGPNGKTYKLDIYVEPNAFNVDNSRIRGISLLNDNGGDASKSDVKVMLKPDPDLKGKSLLESQMTDKDRPPVNESGKHIPPKVAERAFEMLVAQTNAPSRQAKIEQQKPDVAIKDNKTKSIIYLQDPVFKIHKKREGHNY